LTASHRKLYNNIAKIAILILAGVFIYKKLSNNANLASFSNLVSSLPSFKIALTLVSVFLLMLVNWILEALKWRFLLKKIEKIKVAKAIESVFCGLTMAVFTPNRIGEYGGRVFFLSPRRRVPGLVAMGIGSVGQLVLTNVLGSIAVTWFVFSFFRLNTISMIAVALATIIFCGFFLTLFFNVGVLIKYLSRIKWLKRYDRFFQFFSGYIRKDLLKVFSFCLGRFAVFTSQYCIVINMFIPGLPVFSVAMMVFILFFIQSALPSLDLLDVGVRAFTASYFFSFITDQQLAVIATTAFIWLVNLIIPAILGAPFIFKLNFFGTNRN
jgi:hypothetical protein